MKHTAIRILTLVFSLTLLLGVLPLSVAAEDEPWDGSARTFKMKAGDEKFFIYTPTETGAHTIERQYSVLRVTIEPATDKDGYPEMIDVSGMASPNDVCYRLTAGVPYRVRIYMYAFETDWPDGFEDTIAIRPGTPALETDLATPFPADGALKLKVKPGEQIKYKFTPSESGTYVLYSKNTVVKVQVRNGPNDFNTPEYQLFIANPFGKMFGYMMPLTAGETYLIVFSRWENETEFPDGLEDTYYLEKAKPIQSVALRSAHDPNATDLFGYVNSDLHLFGYTNPLYYQSTISDWSISDTSIASFAMDGSGYLVLNKAGTVTVTAKVSGQTATATIRVYDRPELKLNETTTLTFGGSVGAECTFTPSESGRYRFSMTGTGGTTLIPETGDGTYWEGSGSLSAYLTAGKTYTLSGSFGPASHTIKVTKDSTSDPTNALPSGDEPTDTTAPSSPEDPDQTTVETVATNTNSHFPSATKPVNSDATQVAAPLPSNALSVLPKDDGKGYLSHEEVVKTLEKTDTVHVVADSADMTALVISAETLTTTAQANATLQVQMADATILLDAKAMTKVAAQLTGDTLELSANAVDSNNLNDLQREALKAEKSVTAVRLLLTDGETEIHDFGNGTVTVSFAVTPKEGTALSDYDVFYLAKDGTLSKLPTTVKDGVLTFETDHFSEYVALYRPTEKTEKPINVGKIILFSSIAFLLILGGGVAIFFISKRANK